MKKISYLLVLLILTACEKEDTNTIPSYIKIDNITLDEVNTTENITDAWVYIDDKLQVYY